MGLPLPAGKLPTALLRELLGERDAWPSELRLGPAVGEDACAIDVPAGTLVAAADPITLTGSEVGAHAVVVNANDVAVMGVRPRWFLAVVLLPEGSDVETARALFAGLRAALERVGATLVGGHSEVTKAVRQPVVVGQMLGHAADGRFVATGGVRPRDRIVQIGPVPVEGAAVLAREASEALEDLEPGVWERAHRALDAPGISVVEPALAAAGLGATALHDPTEGGLAAGLLELADASRVRLRIDSEAVLWFEPGLAVCRRLGADPWSTLASGALLAAFPEDRAEAAVTALRGRGAPAAVLGVAEPGRGVTLADGRALDWPERDEVARVLSR